MIATPRAAAIKIVAERVREALKEFRDWFRSLDEGQRQILAWGGVLNVRP